MRYIQISENALNLSIPVPLTNEIPHVPTYELLNRQLKNTWAEQFIGKASAGFNKDFKSIKTVNGLQAELYTPRHVRFSEPSDQKIYDVNIGKINISVDGAWETEMDYLMHEMSRYLSKLYPDDFNTLITLTEAERQSYFNEALHMLHSYFDTEQLTIDSPFEDLYYRNRFITGITKVRSFTGVYKQEELLANLLNTGNLQGYSGYTTYLTSLGEPVITNTQPVKADSEAVLLYNYQYLGPEIFLKSSVSSRITLTRADSFINLLDDTSTIQMRKYITSVLKPFYRLDVSDVLSFLQDLCIDDENSLNKLFYKATMEGFISEGANLNNLLETELGSTDLFENLSDEYYLPTNTNEVGFVPIRNGDEDLTPAELCSLTDSFLINKTKLKNADSAYLIKTGDIFYTDDFLLAIGNLIFSNLTRTLLTNEILKTMYTNCIDADSSSFFQVTAKQSDKTVFRGFFAKTDYVRNLDTTKIVDNLSYELFEDKYHADYLFAYYDSPKDLGVISLDRQSDIEITYSMINLSSLAQLSNIYITDDVNYETPLEVSFQKYNNYYLIIVELNSVKYTGTSLAGVLSAEDGSKIEVVFKENGLVINNVTYHIDSKNGSIYDAVSSTEVGAYVTCGNICNIKHLLKHIDSFVGRVNHTLLDTSVTVTDVIFGKNQTLTKHAVCLNTLGLTVEYYTDLYSLIKLNTSYITKTYSTDTRLIYTTELELNSYLNLPSTVVTTESLSSITVYGKTEDVFYTYHQLAAEVYSSDIICVDFDIRDLLNERGLLKGLLYNNSNFQPVSIYKAILKSNKFYLYLQSDLTDYDTEQSAMLIIKNNEQTYSGSVSSLSKAKREISTNTLYKYSNNYYLLNKEWDTLSEANLNYLFDNLFTTNTEDYADDEKISTQTNIASALSESGYLTILDADSSTFNLVCSLINENKSLYLDSTLKRLRYVPVSLKNFVFSLDNGSYSYLQKDTTPADISFYKVEDLTPFEDLNNIKNAIDLDQLDFESTYKRINRRRIIWGSVVWDKNDTTRSVNVLRTIWSGFLANFDVYHTDDILPSESELNQQSVANTTQNLYNYNYSDNAGNPDQQWLFSTYLSESDSQLHTNILDGYSHKSINTASSKEILRDMENLGINDLVITLNKYDITKNQNVLIHSAVNISNILKDCTLWVDYGADDLSILDKNSQYKAVVQNKLQPGAYTTGQSYKLYMVYNYPFIADTEYSLGLFNTGDSNIDSMLEYFIYRYYLDKCLGYKPLTDPVDKNTILGYISYNKLDFSNQDIVSLFDSDIISDDRVKVSDLSLSKVLNYAASLTDFIPCIVTLHSDYTYQIHCCRFVKTAEKEFRIIQTTFQEPIYADILKSLCYDENYSKTFQVKQTLKKAYTDLLTKNQILIDNYKGDFIDYGIKLDEDTYPTAVDQDSVAYKQLLKDIEGDQTDYLTNLYGRISSFQRDSMTIQDKTFELQDSQKYFKEYYETHVQLSTLDKTDTDLKTCNIHFDQNFNLTNSGYLLLKDIKPTGKRSSYNLSRETKIVDRNYSLSNVHLLALQKLNNKLRLLLQDSSQSFTKPLLNKIPYIRPEDETVTEQLLKNDKVSVGLTKPDPGLAIGYTFYKRKFIAEVSIDSTDVTKLTLVDSTLNNDSDFDLSNHISTGDRVEIRLINAPGFYQEGSTVELGLVGGEDDPYVGPYKVVYTTTATETGSLPGSTVKSLQKIILAGPGNIVYVELSLGDSPSITISKPYNYTPSTATVYALSSGELVYYDTTKKGIVQIGTVDTYLACKGDSLLARVQMENSNGNVVSIASSIDVVEPSVSAYVEQTLSSKHSDWYNFAGTSELGDTEITSDTNTSITISDLSDDDFIDTSNTIVEGVEPVQVFDNIPLNDGTLNFDNSDRIFYEPGEDSDEEVSWRCLPDEAEMFDASGTYDAFYEIDDDSSRNLVNIEDATKAQLIEYIHSVVEEIFSEASENSILSNLANVEGDVETDTLLETSTTFDTSIKDTDTHIEVSLKTLAQVLFSTTGSVNIETDSIYLPTFSEIDVPLYLNDMSEPKWQKVNVITGKTTTKIDDADLADLRVFARAILSINYNTRNAAHISSYAKNSRNIVAWDQSSGTLTIMDNVGNLQKRIAIPGVGYRQPIITENLSTGGVLTTYSVPNRLYLIATDVIIDQYLESVLNRAPITIDSETWSIYSIFGVDINNVNNSAPLYLPRVFSEYSGKTKSQIETLLKEKNLSDDVIDEYANLLLIASNEDSFKNERVRAIYQDLLATDGCEYVSFKDTQASCNIKLLKQLFDDLGMTTQSDYVTSITKVTADTLNPYLVKGTPYLNNSAMQDYALSKLYSQKTPLISVSTTGSSVYGFESLIEHSGIELTDNFVHIYGTIHWPKIAGTNNDIIAKLKAQINAKLDSTSIAAGTYKDLIAEQFANDLIAELKTNFESSVQGEEYPTTTGGSYPFKYTVNLNTYQVVQVTMGTKINDKLAEIVSLTSVGESLTALTTGGSFEIGDQESSVIAIDTSEISTVEGIQKGIIQVYDAIKTVNSLSSAIQLDSNGSLSLALSGTVIQNTETIYSTVAMVNSKDFTLRDEAIILDPGAVVNAVVLVKDLTKDNFQLGYGNITGLDNIPVAKTLFEVSSKKYADFASYENKESVNVYKTIDTDVGLYTKDSVFDLYPTWEEIETDKSNFYEVDDSGDLTYLTNENGRNILRILPVVSDTSGGQLFIRNSIESVAGESLTDEFLTKEYTKDPTSLYNYVLSNVRCFNKSYKDLFNNYSFQKIPALVQNAWDAVLTYPYKIIDISITGTNSVDVFDDYVLVTINSDTDLTGIQDLYKGSLNTTFATSNLVQLQSILSKQSDYTSLDTATLQSDENTSVFFSNTGKLLSDSFIDEDNTGLTIQLDTTDDYTKATVVNRTTMSNSVITREASVPFEGLLGGDWFILQQNAVVSELDLKIINKTEYLPKLVNITKYKWSCDDSVAVLDTDSEELYIPKYGYGQSLLSDYTTPVDCVFDSDDTRKFFGNSETKTVNNEGTQFRLVDEDGNQLYNSDGSLALVPKLLYKSFAQADSDLDINLSVSSDNSLSLQDVLIDLTQFTVDTQNISFNTEQQLQQIMFKKLTSLDDSSVLYALYKENIDFTCKLSWSEKGIDFDTNNVITIDDDLINQFSDIKSQLGYTRLYKNFEVPINYTYLQRDGTYITTTTGPARDLHRYSADSDGNLIYMSLDGEITTSASVNKPIPAVKSITKSILSIKNKIIKSIAEQIELSDYALNFTRNNCTFKLTQGFLTSLIFKADPNQQTSFYIKGPKWTSFISARWVFNSFKINLMRNKKDTEYNFAVLHDKQGNVVSTIHFDEPLTKDELLVVSVTV